MLGRRIPMTYSGIWGGYGFNTATSQSSSPPTASWNRSRHFDHLRRAPGISHSYFRRMERLAFVDVETTGLDPTESRIVEIEILITDLNGHLVDSFESVVNPLTRMAATKVHGIRASTVAAAPTFEMLAPEISQRLQNTTVIAYNASFDSSFVTAELSKAGGALAGDWFCAMTHAAQSGKVTQRKLVDVAAELGLQQEGEAHSAFVDADLCRQVFFALPPVAALPRISCTFPVRQQVPPLPRSGAINQGTSRRPVVPDRSLSRTDANLAPIVEELREAFEDHELSLRETKALASKATTHGLSAGDLIAAFNDFLDIELVKILEDGVVESEERAWLRAVSHHLGFPAPYVESRLSGATRPQFSDDLQPGMIVVFTDLWVEEEWDLTMACADAGIAVRSTMSKGVDLLVAAEGATTGKVRRANELGTPIMSVSNFSQALDSYLERRTRTARSETPIGRDRWRPSAQPVERVRTFWEKVKNLGTSRSEPRAIARAIPSGWFVDPTGKNQWRWWDGTTWTSKVGNDGVISDDPT